jgi:Meckel syndrome type 1 protein
MRTNGLVVAVLLATMAVPGAARAVVVVRHPVYHPVATAVAVAVVVSVVTKPPPSTPPPPPSAPRPPPVTTPLPIDATMWSLPSDCLKVSVNGETYYQCGPSWMVPQQCDQGPYYQVVPAPEAPPAAPSAAQPKTQ